jgi:chemotaxis protein CheC
MSAVTDYSKINSVQLDALREIGNIGAGHAATSLSGMINQKVMIDVCRADLMNVTDMGRIFNQVQGDILDIQLGFSGRIKGSIHYVMSKEGALDFMDMFKAGPDSIDKKSTAIDLTDLNERGSRLLTAYLNAISDLAQFSLVAASPAARYAHVVSCASEILSKQHDAAHKMVFCIETAFIAVGKKVTVYFLFLTDQQGFELIFKHLGVE